MTTLKAGRINRLFGTDGGVMLSLYDAFPDAFDPARTPLLVTIDSLEVPLWCERFERRGASGAVAAFADMDTRRRAEELLGLEFRIPDTNAPADDDAFYLEDLIGFEVEVLEAGTPERPSAASERQKQTGTLTDYFDSEANPLFELEIDSRKVLVPAVEEFIARIDFEGRRIYLVLPEGLLDLN